MLSLPFLRGRAAVPVGADPLRASPRRRLSCLLDPTVRGWPVEQSPIATSSLDFVSYLESTWVHGKDPASEGRGAPAPEREGPLRGPVLRPGGAQACLGRLLQRRGGPGGPGPAPNLLPPSQVRSRCSRG